MSTKLYNGFRLSARNLRDALDDLGEVSKLCEVLMLRRQGACIAELAVRQIDRLALAGLAGYPSEIKAAEEPALSPIRYAWDKLEERQAEVRKTRRRDPGVDYELIFQLWLCRETTAFIGYVVAEGAHEVLGIIEKSRVGHEYGFWNNCPGPEHLNDRQWKKREKVWGGLIAGRSGPCFEVKVPEPYITWGVPDAVIQAIPSFERRVARYTQDVAMNEWFATIKADFDQTRPMEPYFRFMDLKENGDELVSGYLARARETVLARLAPEITKQMLQGD